MSSLLPGSVICVYHWLDLIVLSRLRFEAKKMIGDTVDEILREQMPVTVIFGLVALQQCGEFGVCKQNIANLVAVKIVTK